MVAMAPRDQHHPKRADSGHSTGLSPYAGWQMRVPPRERPRVDGRRSQGPYNPPPRPSLAAGTLPRCSSWTAGVWRRNFAKSPPCGNFGAGLYGQKSADCALPYKFLNLQT